MLLNNFMLSFKIKKYENHTQVFLLYCGYTQYSSLEKQEADPLIPAFQSS